MLKVLPDTMLTVRGGLEPVERVVIHPEAPKGSPIRRDTGLQAVEVISPTGKRRWYGTERAFIGSDLRIHMLVNPRDEVLRKWEDSDERTQG